MKSSTLFQKQSFAGYLIFALLVFFLAMMSASCSQSETSEKKTATATKSAATKPAETTTSADKFKTLSSKDTTNDLKLKINVPADWIERDDLNDVAAVQASNKADTLFLAVISEPKDQFDKGTKLEDYADLVIDHYLEGNEDKAKIKKERVKTVVNGRPAVQYEIENKANKIVTVTLLYTVVDAPQGFYQIMAWTLNSQWDEKQSLLRSITDSFREE
ncbi:MAG: hypothetical protein LBB65_09115 [Burkholderiales bacterium]|jgi:hypothetical protein|nr:hypothetical protein [Burkholderiales bacterium]